jgi:amidase
MANVTGWATISLPWAPRKTCPVGVRLMAPDETILLQLAAQLEDAMPWAQRRLAVWLGR